MFHTTRRIAIKASTTTGRQRVVSATNSGVNFGGGPGRSSVSAYSGQGMTFQSLLLGIISEDEESLQTMYQDMYYYDNVAGTAADLKSTLPVSEFNLVGIDDAKIKVYQTNLERLNFPAILPSVYLDMYVRGTFLATMLYNQQRKMFTDMMPHNIKHCEITPSPIYGVPPLIKYKPTEEIQKFLKETEGHFPEVRGRINPELIAALQSKEVVLDPLSTLYLPRKTTSTSSLGVSMFRRLVPLYVLERLLFRGTIAEAQKRQRSTLHIAAGGEDWEPSEEHLQQIVGLFQQADLDPVGAIVATRHDIVTNEIRSGGDFWKWTDVIDVTTTMKLRALGISETFLSGESSYNAMEVALSVFIENLRTDRDYLTRTAFTNTIFPLIAAVNGFTKKDKEAVKGVVASKGGKTRKYSELQFDISDPSQFVMPQVVWAKSLRPEADKDYMEILDTLTEKGVPIPLAMLAAAGGLDLKDLMKHMDEDINFRKEIERKRAALTQTTEDGSTDQSGADEIMRQMEEELSSLKRKGLANRTFEQQDMVTVDHNGKPHHGMNQTRLRRKALETIAKAVTNLAKNDQVYSQRTQQARKVIQSGGIVHSDGSVTTAKKKGVKR